MLDFVRSFIHNIVLSNGENFLQICVMKAHVNVD